MYRIDMGNDAHIPRPRDCGCDIIDFQCLDRRGITETPSIIIWTCEYLGAALRKPSRQPSWPHLLVINLQRLISRTLRSRMRFSIHGNDCGSARDAGGNLTFRIFKILQFLGIVLLDTLHPDVLDNPKY